MEILVRLYYSRVYTCSTSTTAVLQLYYYSYCTAVVQLYKYGIVIHYGDPSQIHYGILLLRNTPYESVKSMHGGLLVRHPPYVKN